MAEQEITPEFYGLSHNKFRPHQREVIEMLLGMSHQQVAIDAPTGSGKTSYAAGVSSIHTTAVLTRLKSLQNENYVGGYRFVPMYGKTDYDCVSPEVLPYFKALDCLYKRNMHECEAYDGCPYANALGELKSSQRGVFNYALWFANPVIRSWLSAGKTGRNYLFLDEAHQLSDIVVDHVSVTIDNDDCSKWGLSEVPIVSGQLKRAVSEVLSWLEGSIAVMRGIVRDFRETIRDYKKDPTIVTKKFLARCHTAEYLLAKLESTSVALEADPDDWFIEIYPGRLVCKPLTARHHFPRLFLSNKWTTIMMSATLGNPRIFAEELGLDEDAKYLKVPNLWSPFERPVVSLPAPKINYTSREDETVVTEQARVIADAINSCDPSWSGIVHVMRKTDTITMAAKLVDAGLDYYRVWTPHLEHSSLQNVESWNRWRENTPGAIAISHMFWEGYDGRDEKISIVAKVPYPSTKESFEKARKEYNEEFYRQRAAWQLEQALGRTRRGVKEDYDTDGHRAGLVAIADSSWYGIRKYLSKDLRSAIISG